MKKMITLVFLFAVFCCARVTAQEPGDSKPLASKNSIKGRLELWRVERVKHRERKLLAKNERQNRHMQKNTYSLKFTGKKKRHPGKNKEKKEKKGTATVDESQVKK